MNIQIEQTETKGTVFLKEEDKRLAEMTYSIAGPQLIIIDHTDIDASLQGKGVGKELLLKLVDKAREENIKIIALCPFAKSVFDKNPDLGDVLK